MVQQANLLSFLVLISCTSVLKQFELNPAQTIDQIRQTYEKKCVQLRNQDAKGSELRCAEKTRTTVRDLYTRIWVSLRAVESISDRIQKLRAEELQPQLVELLQG